MRTTRGGLLIAFAAAGCSSQLRPGVAPDVVYASHLSIDPCADNACEAPSGVDVVDSRDGDAPARDAAADDGADAAPDVIVQTGPPIVFNELSGAAPQWVELVNRSAVPFDLSSYSVTDSTPTGSPNLAQAAMIPRGTMLAPGEFLVVMSNAPSSVGDGGGVRPDCTGDAGVFRCLQASWTLSAGETVHLVSPTDMVVQSAVYNATSLSGDQTLGRLPNAEGEFSPNFGTPGRTNELAVEINEINGAGTDWVELYNPTTGPYDLGNHTLADSLDDASGPRLVEAITFPAGTIVGPHEYLFVLASQPMSTRQPKTVCAPSTAPQCFYAVFGISGSRGEPMWILSPSMTILGRLLLPGGVPSGATWGRLPDGTPTLGNNHPTPGASNMPL